MTPQQFVAKWKKANLSERSAYQQHFLDLCDVLDQPKPAAADPEGAFYRFERGVSKTDGGKGSADVWFRGYFGWEYKGKHKDLAAAYRQLLLYREDLENPPLRIVCDLDPPMPRKPPSSPNCQRRSWARSAARTSSRCASTS